MECSECKQEFVDDIYPCDDCGELLCVECAVMPAPPYAPVEGHVCPTCYDVRGRAAEDQWRVIEEATEAKKKEREKKNAAARRRYGKPENVAKRARQKRESREAQAKAARERLAETFRIVNNMLDPHK